MWQWVLYTDENNAIDDTDAKNNDDNSAWLH